MQRAAETTGTRRGRLARGGRALFGAWLGLVVFAHLGLAGQGYWSDEYFDFAELRRHGAGLWLERVSSWSPRPLAESLLLLDGAAASALGRPLIGSSLALLLGLAGLLLLMATRRRDRLRVFALIALWLCCGHLSEVLYWPASAFAYVPTLLFILLLWLAWSAPAPPGGPATLLLLLGTAASSEVGASFVVLLAAAGTALRTGPGWRWLTGPAVFALLILLRVATFRLLSTEVAAYSDPALQGTVLPAALAALGTFTLEFMRPDAAGGAVLLTLGKLTWLAGCVLTARPPTRPRAALAIALAALAAALLSLFIAYRHFGAACCDRHIAVRDFLVLLALLAAAPLPLCRRGAAMPQPLRRLGAGLLAVGVLMVSLPRIAPVSRQYALYDQTIRQRAETWRSGHDPGPEMTIPAFIDGPLIHPQTVPAGAYRYQPYRLSLDDLMMAYFGKQRLLVH